MQRFAILVIYLEDLSVRVSFENGFDGHGERRPPLTKRVTACHPDFKTVGLYVEHNFQGLNIDSSYAIPIINRGHAYIQSR